MYGGETITSVNDLLVQHFFKAFRPKKNTAKIEDNILAKIKGSDGSSFPPCFRVLTNHILRTAYIAGMNKNNRELPPPSECGFQLSPDGSHYQINWFDGSQYPPTLTEEEVDDPDDADDDVDENDDQQDYDSEEDEDRDDDYDSEAEDFIALF